MTARDGLRAGTAQWWEARTRFDASTGCVLWTGFKDRSGYCRTRWNGKDGTLIHRIAFEQVYGPIAPDLKICHRCDVPYCVNPSHLFAGTQKDNLRDMFRKGRARPQGKATAPLTEFPAVSYRVLRKGLQAVSKEESLIGGDELDLIHLRRTKQDPKAGEPVAASSVTPLWAQVRNVPSVRPTRAVALWDAEALRPDRWLQAVATLQAPNNSRTGCAVSSGGDTP